MNVYRHNIDCICITGPGEYLRNLLANINLFGSWGNKAYLVRKIEHIIILDK